MKRINLSTAFSGMKFNNKKLMFFIIALFSMFSCLVEEEIPETNFEVTIETLDASLITENSAVVGVIISSYDKSQVSLTLGVCYNTTGNPTTSDYVEEGSGELGEFTVSITELNADTRYYARAYVTNVAGTTLYGNEVYFTTMPKSTGTVTDADGNVYHTVTIGTQVWMVENLKTTKYRDGSSIPKVTLASSWTALTSGAYCDYNNLASNSITYGRLYNWYTVSDSRNIAPLGWHVPTDAEWTTLTTYLGGEIVAGGKLKEAGTTHWASPNAGATNESGFTALPSGYRLIDGSFVYIYNNDAWWSSTFSGSEVWNRSAYTGTVNIFRNLAAKECGFSVRCIKDEPLGFPVLTTTSITSITTNSASTGGNITSDGGSNITTRGVCWSTSSNPTTSNSFTTSDSGTGSYVSGLINLTANTTYYVRAFATNSVGTAYGNEVSFKTSSGATVTDIDGNVYKTVTIGTQVWMAENLKTTKYRDGTVIPNITSATEWTVLTTGAYCDYDNIPSNSNTYGRLYNWYVITNIHNIAPTGWHVPTIDELNKLYQYLGSDTLVGGKLKESGTIHWGNPNLNATNTSSFSALPAGFRFTNGEFWNIKYTFVMWTSTSNATVSSQATSVGISYSSGALLLYSDDLKYYGNSIRCVKD